MYYFKHLSLEILSLVILFSTDLVTGMLFLLLQRYGALVEEKRTLLRFMARTATKPGQVYLLFAF